MTDPDVRNMFLMCLGSLAVSMCELIHDNSLCVDLSLSLSLVILSLLFSIICWYCPSVPIPSRSHHRQESQMTGCRCFSRLLSSGNDSLQFGDILSLSWLTSGVWADAGWANSNLRHLPFFIAFFHLSIYLFFFLSFFLSLVDCLNMVDLVPGHSRTGVSYSSSPYKPLQNRANPDTVRYWIPSPLKLIFGHFHPDPLSLPNPLPQTTNIVPFQLIWYHS